MVAMRGRGLQSLRPWWTYWYRRARRRCVVCGGKRRYTSPVWRAPMRYACGWCNKRVQHGMNYGMGADRMRALFMTPQASR